MRKSNPVSLNHAELFALVAEGKRQRHLALHQALARLFGFGRVAAVLASARAPQSTNHSWSMFMNPITPSNFDPATVARLVARGRRLQGEAVAEVFGKLFAALDRVFRLPKPDKPARA